MHMRWKINFHLILLYAIIKIIYQTTKEKSLGTFKILSIDFDYFQNVACSTLSHYPDGIDLPTDISNLVWTMRYVESYQPIHKVTVNESLLQTVIDTIQQQSKSTPVMIVNSHKYAYDFIKEHSCGKDVDLINLDLHHDLFNDSETLDCGNWISHVAKDLKLKSFTWIGRKTSEKMYDMTEEEKVRLHFNLGLDTIKDKKFDAIFICRSDNWTPPHLDTYFEKVLTLCTEMFYDVSVETAILHKRNIDDNVKQMQEAMNAVRQGHLHE